MKCPNCHFDNPEKMPFCGKCGAKIEIICLKCSFANPPDFSFCGKCGQNLQLPVEPVSKDLSFDEKLHGVLCANPQNFRKRL